MRLNQYIPSSLTILCLATFFFNCKGENTNISSLQINGLNENSIILITDFFTNDTLIEVSCFDTTFCFDKIISDYKFENLNLVCFIQNESFKYQEFIPFIKNSENKILIDLSNYKTNFSATIELSGSDELKIVDEYYNSVKSIKQLMYKALNQKELNLKLLDSLKKESDLIGMSFFFEHPKNILSKIFIQDKLSSDPNFLLKNKSISNFIDSICEFDNYQLNNVDLCSYYAQINEVIKPDGAINTNLFYLKARNFKNEFQTLNSIKQKYILVDFWATWCKPCLKDIELTIDKLNSQKYKDELEVVFISIDKDIDKWKSFLPTFFDTSRNIHLLDFNEITKQHYKIED